MVTLPYYYLNMAFIPIDVEKLGADYDYSNNRSGATGKYYFLWDKHADNIKKITGVKDREELLKNPDLQEKYFKWYADNKLKPGIDRLKSIARDSYNDDELAKLIHFKGEAGAKRLLEKENQSTDNISKTGIAKPVKSLPTQDPVIRVPQPVTTARREVYENMQGVAYQRGIYEDDIIIATPKGLALLKEFGIDQNELADFHADLDKKAQDQSIPN